MSATRKVEIHEHPQHNWMDRTIEQLAPYRRAILGLALALVVGIVAIMLLARQNTQKQERAWDNYFTFEQITSANEEAARKMITELGNTEAALMLKMKLGQFLQREGTQLLFSDKKTGTTKVNEAKENFTAVATKSKNTMAVEEAMFAAAMCEDSLGNVAEAIAAYEKQLQKFPQGVYSKIASDNLELLKSSDAKEWYAVFKQADVTKKESIEPFPNFGTRPGSGPGPGPGPGIGPGPMLEGPGSLMPKIDPLGTGVPSSTFGLPDFKIPPSPAATETPAPGAPAKDGAAAPDKSGTEPSSKPAENPLPSLDGQAPATTTPATEKPTTPEPAKSEPAKPEPAKEEPAKTEPAKK